MLLGFEVDKSAIFSKFTDQRIDMAQRELGVALQIAAHEAVVLDPEVEGRSAGIVNGGHAVFFGQRHDTENAADAELGFVAKNRLAELTDVGAGLGGAG